MKVTQVLRAKCLEFQGALYGLQMLTAGWLLVGITLGFRV